MDSMTLSLTYGEAVALAALLSLSHTPLAARLAARLDALIDETRQTLADKEKREAEVVRWRGQMKTARQSRQRLLLRA